MSDCKHFNGIQHDCCKAGVRYKDIAPIGTLLPCRDGFKGGTTCDKHEAFTAAEIAANEAETNRVVEAILSGKSPCCDAPLDESRVIRSKPYKGHGPRYCSECGKFVYQV